jgi:hypothetical protein
MRQEAQTNVLKAQTLMARVPPKFTPYQPGDQVWLEGTNIRTTHPTAKLAPKHHGPFTVKEALSDITYRLDLPSSWKIWNAFHVSLLTPYRETASHGPNFTRPPPDLIEGEEQYEVERILDSKRGRGRAFRYLVKWKGYPDADNQWVSQRDLHAPDLVSSFHQQHPEAPTPLNI